MIIEKECTLLIIKECQEFYRQNHFKKKDELIKKEICYTIELIYENLEGFSEDELNKKLDKLIINSKALDYNNLVYLEDNYYLLKKNIRVGKKLKEIFKSIQRTNKVIKNNNYYSD